ncbi:phosphorylcholine transferase LicD [Ruminococcus sp.]|uniref:LicD family protein n=1 Tax=Ruminococcus sp. TaxID=41978 RepID=UPI00261B11B0|nr:LicD family protein [Ruminococcus sp.]MDD6988281.1 LicD family protein [Ruminococcus sp.]MDY6201131.1 LicD family protein [Ruminococcus sp.]
MITSYDYSKIENYEELRKLQLVQVEILKYIDEFCIKNELRYSIAYGTILGAVRHGGFIPWDDDLDICMPREDYEKFIKLWKDTDKYLLQDHNTNPDFTQSFTKIRKKNTAFVQKTDIGLDYHKGIFVDVFPFDKVPESAIKRKIQSVNVMFYNLYMRGYAPTKSGTLVRAVSKLILKLTPRSKYLKKSNKYLSKICKYNDNKNLKYVDASVTSTMHMYYDNDIFDNMKRITFENIEVFALNKRNDFLEIQYGDYMKFPPESEQTWYHHPIYISFDNEYTEGQNKNE